MSEVSTFKSRTGKLAGSAENVFSFVSDIRNFKRFIPEGNVSDIKIEQDSCSFRMSMLGTVNIRIAERVPGSQILFSGNALQLNDFSIILKIRNSGIGQSEADIMLNAEMNPFLKMMAAEPVKKFLEILIDEMEKFRDWNNII